METKDVGLFLTVEQKRIMFLLEDGMTTREIASTMGYSERSVKYKLHAMNLRYNTKNRTQLIALLIRTGRL